MVNNVSKRTRGFTLLETLVAIFILTMSLAGPLIIASKGLTTAQVAKNRITAYYLAQDGIEYVRFVRDTNKIVNSPWLTRLNNCVSTDGSVSCTVDSYNDKIGSCSSTCPVLTFDPKINGGYFSYDPAPTSIFTRTISITTPVGGNAAEASVAVIVSWRDNAGLIRSVTVKENIFDWQ